MSWHSIYRTLDGVLLAHTSVLPENIDPLWSVVDHADRMDQANVWDPLLRTWSPRPPEPVVDRLADLAAHPYVSDVWSRLTAAQRVKLRRLIVWLLGAHRYRHPNDEVSIDPDNDWPTDPSAVSE